MSSSFRSHSATFPALGYRLCRRCHKSTKRETAAERRLAARLLLHSYVSTAGRREGRTNRMQDNRSSLLVVLFMVEGSRCLIRVVQAISCSAALVINDPMRNASPMVAVMACMGVEPHK